MAEQKSYALIAPPVLDFIAPAKIEQWYTSPGYPVQQGAVIVSLTDGFEGRYQIVSPCDALFDQINIYAGEEAATGKVLGSLLVPADFQIETERDWNNFDKLSDLLEEYSDKARDPKQLRDMNDALGELLGVKEEAVFQKMNTDQQNQFLQNLVEQHTQQGLSPQVVARKMLEGLQLRTPQFTPRAPAPSLGFRPSGPSGPGGMGGGAGMGGQQRVSQQSFPIAQHQSDSDDQ